MNIDLTPVMPPERTHQNMATRNFLNKISMCRKEHYFIDIDSSTYSSLIWEKVDKNYCFRAKVQQFPETKCCQVHILDSTSVSAR
jgi:hypothetical protein